MVALLVQFVTSINHAPDVLGLLKMQHICINFRSAHIWCLLLSLTQMGKLRKALITHHLALIIEVRRLELFPMGTIRMQMDWATLPSTYSMRMRHAVPNTRVS